MRKGSKMTDIQKENLSLAHLGRIPWNKGKPWDKDTKQKMRDAKLKNPSPTQFKKGHKGYTAWLGKKRIFDEEYKKNMKEVCQNPKYRELKRSQRLNQVLPTKDTSIELKLQNELTNKKIVFQKHYPILGQPDIVIPDKKIAIFCDGDYWHNRPEVKERDLKVNETLQNKGWIVLRFWEDDINKNIEKVVDRIEEILWKGNI